MHDAPKPHGPVPTGPGKLAIMKWNDSKFSGNLIFPEQHPTNRGDLKKIGPELITEVLWPDLQEGL